MVRVRAVVQLGHPACSCWELLPVLEMFWGPSGFEQHPIRVLEIPSHREHGCVKKSLLVG